DDQGHARTNLGGGTTDSGDRQGTTRGRDRRRAAGGRSDETPGVRAADRLVGIGRHQRIRVHSTTRYQLVTDAADASQFDPVRLAAGRLSIALLSPPENRYQHTHAGEPATANHRRYSGTGEIWRADSDSRHDV